MTSATVTFGTAIALAGVIGALAIRSSGSPGGPAASTVPQIVAAAATGLFDSGQWNATCDSWIWVPDAMCDQPWIHVSESSEETFLNDSGKNPTHRHYNTCEQGALFTAWQSCGNGSTTFPNLPPGLPPGDSPLGPPDGPDPLCMGFGCTMDPPLGPAPGKGAPDPILCEGLGCGWIDPDPEPGDGKPDPREICEGLDCGWINPEPTPPEPPTPDYCMGMDCPMIGAPGPPPDCGGGGGGVPCLSVDPEGCEPKGPGEIQPLPPSPPLKFPPDSPAPMPTIDSGPASPIATPNPVNFSYGNKNESAIDLVVPLTGRDFVLARSYNSKPDMGGAAMVGFNWGLNVFQFIEVIGTAQNPPLKIQTPAGGARTFTYNTSLSKWIAPGPSSQFITKTSVTIDSVQWPVYRLTEPGSWSVDFYCANNSSQHGGSWGETPSTHIGLILQQRDNYNNVKTYTYSVSNQNNGNADDDAARLDVIYLNGTDAENCEASVHFQWYDINNDDLGRLQTVTVKRPSGSSTVDAQKVEYVYKKSTDNYSGAVGFTGDLIQVVKSVLVDRAPASQQPWHITVTQYRYHNGAQETGTDSDGDGFSYERGVAHSLKAVIMPEQIEYAAQKAGSSSTPPYPYDSVRTFADSLLTKADGDTAFSDGGNNYKVMNLAAKVIETYLPSDPYLSIPYAVMTQYLQSACGCSGGSSQGLKLTYTYKLAYGVSASDGNFARSTQVQYFRKDETTGYFPDYPFLTYHYDLVKYTIASEESTAPAYYLANMAIEDADSHRWVVHADYDSTSHVRTRMISTSAVSSYTPATSSVSPYIDFDTSHGLVQEYEYTDLAGGFRLKQLGLKRGTGGPLNIVTKTTFDTTRKWLPTKLESFRKEDLASGNASSGADDIQQVDFSYGFHSGDIVAWIETKFEAEAAAENGPGGNYYAHSFFDTRGRNYWTRRADDVLIHRTFDDATGALLTSEANCGTTGLPSHPSPSGASWSGRNSQGGSLTSTYTYDLLGRIKSVSPPSGITVRYAREIRAFVDSEFSHYDDRPGILYYAVVGLPHHYTESSQDRFAGPASLRLYNAAGHGIASMAYSLTSDSTNGYGSLFSGYTFNLSSELARATTKHALTGLTMASTQWHNLAGQGDHNGYYESTYEYDSLGRVSKSLDPAGNITQYDYDSRSRVIKVQVGTTTQNMQTLEELFYDSGGAATQEVGDGVVTLIRQYTGESGGAAQRDTKLTYDYRSRVVKVENADGPDAFFVYDNVERVVKAAIFSTLPSGSEPADIDASGSLTSRGMYAETSYGQRGMAYRGRLAVNPTTTDTNYLETHTWYDAIGRIVGQWGPNSPGVKITYNALGQVKATYVTDRGSDGQGGSGSFAYTYSGSPDYKANLSGDVVFQQTSYDYRASKGLLDLVTSRARTHGAADSKTGDLALLTGSDANLVITTFGGAEYDNAARVVGVIDFGTNSSGFTYGGTAPSLDSSVPPRWTTGSADIEVSLAYNTRGQIETATDPLGRVSKVFYDDLGRDIAVAENWQQATVTWSTSLDRWVVGGAAGDPDVDRVTSTVYRITANEVDLVAHRYNGSTDSPQITKYLTANNDGVTAQDLSTANGLLRRIKYPDVETSQDDYTVAFGYNRQGEVRYTRDQNNTTHAFTRNLAGNVTLDEATVDSNGPIDGTFNKIEASYDNFGRPTAVVSKAGTTVKNEVQFTYTALWQINEIIQEPTGAVTGSSKKVSYAYDTLKAGQTDGNYSRPSTMTYPDGSVLTAEYGSSGTSGNRVSRPLDLKLGSTEIVHYSYLGLGAPVIVDYVPPDVLLDRSLAHDGSRTTGQYPALDRFGRVIRHEWADGALTAGSGSGAGYPTKPPIVELAYSYNKASDITEKYDARPGAKQALNRQYLYDELLRLMEAKKGSGSGTGFTQAAGSQQWNLDVIGDWAEFDTDLTGDGAYTATGDRQVAGQFNDANEVSEMDVTTDGSTRDLDFDYDKAGNLRQQHVTMDDSLRYTHDAWGRLVKTEYLVGSTPYARGEYQYNGLSQRVVKRSDHNTYDNSAQLDEQRLMFYSGGWQIVEERIYDGWSSGSPGSVDRIVQHVWGLRYIDDLVLNRQDSNVDGDYTDTGDFTHYALTDHQFSVVALIDSSSANLIERVEYTPYGEARHHWKYDVDGDGDVDAADGTAVSTATGSSIYQSSYNADADFDRDGDVDRYDTLGSYAGALPAGQISDLSVGNSMGYCGYVFNGEAGSGGLYTVRFRHLDPGTGRWLERDPAGYHDSMSLYAYGSGGPLFGADSFGLNWFGDAWYSIKRFYAGDDPLHKAIAELLIQADGNDFYADTPAALLYTEGIVLCVLGAFVIVETAPLVAAGALELASGIADAVALYTAMAIFFGDIYGIQLLIWAAIHEQTVEFVIAFLMALFEIEDGNGSSLPTPGSVLGSAAGAAVLGAYRVSTGGGKNKGKTKYLPPGAPASAPDYARQAQTEWMMELAARHGICF